MPLFLLVNGGELPGSLRFVANIVTALEREGAETAVSLTRAWLSAPPLTPGIVPNPQQLHETFGGDPIQVRINGRFYDDRLFVGGLACQSEKRPFVDAVLNLGETPSRWSPNPVDRWHEKGEGTVGMSVDEIIDEAEWVIERLQQDQRVLVHCVAGFNRSVTICCAVLMRLEAISAEAALSRVRQHHPWAYPDSQHWLMLQGLGV